MSNQSSQFIIGKVIENTAFTERLFSLRIRADQQAFKAGQFVRLRLSIQGEDVARPYSLINSPDEKDIEVFYNTVKDGLLTNELIKLKSGDSISVSQPAYGFFILDEVPECKHLWMIATGTGLGPYISILKTKEVWERFEKVVLVHGIPSSDEIVYTNLIQSFENEFTDQFKFVPCVSKEFNHSVGLQGRVTKLLENDSLEQFVGLNINCNDSHIMLCGNQNMIDDMKNLLAKREMKKHRRRDPGHITTEQYF